MPKSGNSGARPAGAAGGRKPRHGKSTAAKKHGAAGNHAVAPSERKHKIREDGRGGRSPAREGAREERSTRPISRDARFDRASKPARGRFDRDERSTRDEGEDRGGRQDRRRDWSPISERPKRGARPERGERAERGERSDRPDRFERGGRPGATSGSRPERGSRPDFRDSAERSPHRRDRVERDNNRDRAFEERRRGTPNKKTFFEDEVLERLKYSDDAEVVITHNFGDMGLHPRLVTALEGMGAESPFPIQAATIPAAIEGRDVLGRGKTGSGKTIAFSVPIITKLVAGGSQPRVPNQPRALILAPTRELADQINRTASPLARAVGFYTTTVYGGVPQRKQEIALNRGVDILVATPGRLEDLMAQRVVDLSAVETIVIDEADHMCDLGFIDGVRRIMAATGDSQKLLFSATLDREVDALVREFMPKPFVYEVPNEDEDTSNIEHRVLVLRDEDRSQVLLRLVQGAGKALIFTRTKATAETLSESLTEAGVPAARLHGDLNQSQRNRNLERFTRGNARVLVATDVAARGIHVDDVALVIQLDPPMEYKTYLHRAGRTGRAGKTGVVITMIPRQRRRRIEDLLNRAERDAIFTDVWPNHELLEQLAGPIAPPPATEVLDFGDGRGKGRAERAGGRDDRGSRGDRPRSDRPRGAGGDRADRGDRPRGNRPYRDGGSDRPARSGAGAGKKREYRDR